MTVFGTDLKNFKMLLSEKASVIFNRPNSKGHSCSMSMGALWIPYGESVCKSLQLNRQDELLIILIGGYSNLEIC